MPPVDVADEEISNLTASLAAAAVEPREGGGEMHAGANGAEASSAPHPPLSTHPLASTALDPSTCGSRPPLSTHIHLRLPFAALYPACMRAARSRNWLFAPLPTPYLGGITFLISTSETDRQPPRIRKITDLSGGVIAVTKELCKTLQLPPTATFVYLSVSAARV